MDIETFQDREGHARLWSVTRTPKVPVPLAHFFALLKLNLCLCNF